MGTDRHLEDRNYKIIETNVNIESTEYLTGINLKEAISLLYRSVNYQHKEINNLQNRILELEIQIKAKKR